jgi:lactoylglutathione lyase
MNIEHIDHVGIRVTHRQAAIDFYACLGFAVEHEVDFDAVVILKNAAGVELNLICNGVATEHGGNRLMDEPTKWPGVTHVALRVPDMAHTQRVLAQHGIAITQGPVTFGDGHVSVFVRDPDRNVVELRARMPADAAQRIEGLTFYDPKA